MFYYKVEYITNDYDIITETGLCKGISYADAAKRLSDYYGSKIISLTIEEWDEIITIDDIREAFLQEKEEKEANT